MNRKIFKTGHSLAVTISKEILDELGLKLGDSVKVEYDAIKNRVVISPAKNSSQLPLDLHIRPRLGSLNRHA